MAKYPSKNLKKGETLKFTLSFDEPQGPWPDKFGGPDQFCYGIRADGKMINLYLPNFVSACIEALEVKKGAELTLTNVDYKNWKVVHNGTEYDAIGSGEAKDAVPSHDTPQSDEFNGVVDIARVMEQCWTEAELIISKRPAADATPDQVLNETGLTARCMFIEYHKSNNK